MSKPNDYVWLKYRHTYSYEAAEWNWKYLGVGRFKDFEEKARELAIDISDEFNWSEQYRGLDWKLVSDVPRKIVEDEVKKNKEIIENCKEVLGDMLQILELINLEEAQ